VAVVVVLIARSIVHAKVDNSTNRATVDVVADSTTAYATIAEATSDEEAQDDHHRDH